MKCDSTLANGSWRCASCDFEPQARGRSLVFCEPEGPDGFEPEGFARLVQLEEGSFWFRSRNQLILWALANYFPECRRLLEIGCGTGFVLEGIARAHPSLELAGAELHGEGLSHAGERVPDADLYQFDARDIPFREEFDVIGAFDVLEHINADELVLAQIRAALKPRGGLLLTVPQHPALWSAADEYAHHERRYRRPELVEKAEAAGFVVRRMTSFVSFLLPAMFASRMRERLGRRTFDPGAELTAATRFDRLFETISDRERALIERGIDLPAGGSLLMVAQRI